MKKQVTINGESLYFNIHDVDFAEKFDKYEPVMQREIQYTDKDIAEDEIRCMRGQCNAVKKFFDSMYGEGTSEKLFAGRSDLEECFDAMIAVYSERDAQEAAFTAKTLSVAGNREQRRAASKGKKKQ